VPTKFDDPLNTVVRLDDATPVIRIPRKRKKERLPEEKQGSEDFARIADPETPAELAETLLVSGRELTDDDISEEKLEQTIRTATLNEFEVEKLVDLLVSMTCLITGRKYHKYQITWIRRIFRGVLLDTPEESRVITVNISRQAGKCFKKGTRIMMSDGSSKNVEDVIPGDYVMGADSLPKKVLSLARGRESMYEVTPRAGYAEPYTVNESHILALLERRGGKKSKRKLNISVRDYKKLSDSKKADGVMGYKSAVSFSDKPLPVEPYWFGLWLGDGSSRDVKITSEDMEVVQYLGDYAETLGLKLKEYTQKNDSCSDWAIVNEGGLSWALGVPREEKADRNPLRKFLNTFNLINNKHIPSMFMRNSESKRLDLLAGIIDSDGHVSHRKGKESTCEITSKYESLATQYMLLARSLGFRASIKSRTARIKSIGFESTVFRVCIYGDLSRIPTKIERKKSEKRDLREDPLSYGFDLTPKGKGEYFGFSIEGEDKLFLLEDFTVVHNSEGMAGVGAVLPIVIPALAKIFPEQLGRYKDGFHLAIFAPSDKQSLIIYKRIQKFARGANAFRVYEDDDFNLKIDRHGLSWSNGSWVVAQSANPKSSMDGLDLHAFIFDEAQDGDAKVCAENIEPMLAYSNGVGVYVGRCSEVPGYFYEMIQINTEQDSKLRENQKANFHYDYKEVSKENPYYARYAEGQKRRHGFNSSAFKLNFRLIWMFEEGLPVTKALLTEYCFKKIGVIRYCVNETVVAGIDLGRLHTSTVTTVGKVIRVDQITEYRDEIEIKVGVPTVQVMRWLMLESIPYPQQRPLIYEFLKMYRTIRLCAVDTTGGGISVFDEMENEWPDIPLLGYNFNPATKTVLASTFNEYVHSNRLIIPANEDARKSELWQHFFRQMVSLRKVVSGNHVYLERDTSKTTTRDDFPDSLFLMLYAAKQIASGMHGTEVLDNANLFGSAAGAAPAGGLEERRRAIREGRASPQSLKEQRQKSLFVGA